MKLNETIEFMLSDNYKERFKAEYYQAKIRMKKLHDILIKYDAEKLDFKLAHSVEVLKIQYVAMREYIYTYWKCLQK